ncbi:MAG: hypothetical protein ACK56F_25040, partial [bacterium]
LIHNKGYVRPNMYYFTRHLGARSAGLLGAQLLALDSRSAKLAGGLSSGPILSGLGQTGGHTKSTDIILWAFNKNAHLMT